MARLVAAISLLERSPKTAAPSDPKFDFMLNDYRRSLEAARAVLFHPADNAPTHHHKKRASEITVLGQGRMQCESPVGDMAYVILYLVPDGSLWARPSGEITMPALKK